MAIPDGSGLETGTEVLRLVRPVALWLKVAKEREALKGVNASGLLRDLKKAYRDWEANRIGDKEYNDIAHRCQGLFERLGDIGRVSEGMYDKFEAEYTANMYAMND